MDQEIKVSGGGGGWSGAPLVTFPTGPDPKAPPLALLKALSKFKGLMKPLKRDKANPHYKSMYVTLDSILDGICEPFNECGLLAVQIPLAGQKLRTIIYHVESGESIEGTMDLVLEKNGPQGQGSALTYARRYSLSAMLGLATEEDDDGNAASGIRMNGVPITGGIIQPKKPLASSPAMGWGKPS
jgi:hypothetical protein